jgi:hypothetical protein
VALAETAGVRKGLIGVADAWKGLADAWKGLAATSAGGRVVWPAGVGVDGAEGARLKFRVDLAADPNACLKRDQSPAW